MQASPLIDGINAKYLLAERGYDTNEIIDFLKLNSIIAVIPSKKNRKQQRYYDTYLYKLRHLIENAFLKLKRLRGVATHYAKTTSAFPGAVVLASILHWIKIV